MQAPRASWARVASLPWRLGRNSPGSLSASIHNGHVKRTFSAGYRPSCVGIAMSATHPMSSAFCLFCFKCGRQLVFRCAALLTSSVCPPDVMMWTKIAPSGAQPNPLNCHSMTLVGKRLFNIAGFSMPASLGITRVFDVGMFALLTCSVLFYGEFWKLLQTCGRFLALLPVL